MQKFSLKDLELIDGPLQPEFENLTQLAQSIIGAEVSLVSTIDIDNDRQFFTSQKGLAEPWAGRRQTPLSHSFCQHVVRENQPLVVEDARITPLVADNLAIPDLGVIAYLGVPVHMPDGEPIAALCVIEGTPRVWTEAEISRLQQLARCVTDAIKMKAALKEAAQVNQEQREFTYAVSHDLKSPASTLNLLLHELETESAGLNEDGLFLLSHSRKTARRMITQMNDILEYARVLGARINKERINLSDLVSELVEDLQGEITQADALIEIADLPVVTGNRMQLRCLFQNLITNGIKFRSPSRNPVVSISAVAGSAASLVQIDVRDNGIGISQKDQQQIFQLFKKLHNPAEYDGSGIGLTLSKRICTNHNGRLEVLSDVGQGATFRVTLPSAPQA